MKHISQILVILVIICISEGGISTQFGNADIAGLHLGFYFYSPSTDMVTTDNETVDIKWYWWNPEIYDPSNNFSTGTVRSFRIIVFSDINSTGVTDIDYNGTFPYYNVSLDSIPTTYTLNFSRFITSRQKTTFGIVFIVTYYRSGFTVVESLYKVVWTPKELNRIHFNIPVYTYYLIGIVGGLFLVYAIYWYFYSCSSEESLNTNYCKQKLLKVKYQQKEERQKEETEQQLAQRLFTEGQ